MNKNLHDLSRSLKRSPQQSGRKADTCPPQERPPKLRERSLQWRLIEALQQADPAAESLLASAPTQTEKQLLEGICALWRGDVQRAEQTFLRVCGQIVSIGRCWAHLHLAILGLETGREDLVDHHLSRARRYSYEDRLDRQCLSAYIDLLEIRADLERGATERARNRLSSILDLCQDPYLRAIGCYLAGSLARYGIAVDEGRQRAMEALELFEQQHNVYYIALTRLLLSYLSHNSVEAKELAVEAAAVLEQLGRTREAIVARSRTAQQLVKEEQFERVGDCLFISAPMKAIRLRLNAIAGTSHDPVLILGPRGSGKEMLAQAIHLLSPRSQAPMLTVNCGALPENLVESELFGYEKGAFTGAVSQKRGLFELADGGTIFLDEIAELPLQSQTKLLRVLQTGHFRRLGGTTELHSNVRIIAATNRNLDEMARNGDFREDLLDRLSVWRLRLPPLSHRREEILPLAEEFLHRYGQGQFRLDSSARRFLHNKDYPGNVRVLENDIRRAVAKARAAGTSTITADLIVDEFDNEPLPPTRPQISEIPNYEEAMLTFERDLLLRALTACGWNKKLASNSLGMSERTFWRAIQRHNLYSKPEEYS